MTLLAVFCLAVIQSMLTRDRAWHSRAAALSEYNATWRLMGQRFRVYTGIQAYRHQNIR